MTERSKKIELLKGQAMVVGYTRVSSEEQTKNFSLSTQEKYIKEECARRDLKLVKVFREEGKSAKTLDRPALIKCLSYCSKNKEKISALVIYRLDRLSRETSDYLAVRKQLAKYGIDLISASEPIGGTSPTDKFMETILASVATLDNEIRAQRAKDGLRARFMSGLPTNKPPVGYKVMNKKVFPDKEMYPKVKKAWEVMKTGTKTLSEIAKYMNDLAIKTYWNGKHFPINKKSARRIFGSKFYHGIIESKDWGQVKGRHKKMIDEDTYWKVQAIIEGRNVNHAAKRLRLNPDFPLRNVIRCNLCGRGMTGSWSKGRSKKYAYYFCPNWCKGSVPRDDMEEKLATLLREITPTRETIEKFNLLLRAEYHERHKGLKAKQRKAKIQVKDTRWMLKQLVRGHSKGDYPDAVFVEMKKEYEHELIAKNAVLNETIIDRYDIEAILNFSEAFLADLAKPYMVGDLGQKRVFLGSIFPKGLVWKRNLLEPPKLASMFAFLSPKKTFGGADVFYLELPIMFLNTLREAYPSYKEQFSYV